MAAPDRPEQVNPQRVGEQQRGAVLPQQVGRLPGQLAVGDPDPRDDFSSHGSTPKKETLVQGGSVRCLTGSSPGSNVVNPLLRKPDRDPAEVLRTGQLIGNRDANERIPHANPCKSLTWFDLRRSEGAKCAGSLPWEILGLPGSGFVRM